MIVNRVMIGLEYVINNDQKGFMPDRRMSSNIRKIFDVIKKTERDEIEAIILQIDFAKAFDKCELTALIGSMQVFNFASYLQKWTSILYSNFKVRIQNNGRFSNPIDIQRSVHQGGPASAAYFLCIAEMLAIRIRENDQIQGVFVREIENLLNQFADDTDMTLDASEGNRNVLNHVFSDLEWFRACSGCTVNYDKTTVYRIGSLKKSKAELYTEADLNWEETAINVLGIDIHKDDEVTLQKNYEKITVRAKARLKSWAKRHLSLIGKVNIINTLIASLFVHPMSVLPSIPDQIIKDMEKTFEAFIWNGHKPKIPLRVLKLSKQAGGLGLCDLKLKDKSIKAAWVKQLMDDEEIANLAHDALGVKIDHMIWLCNLRPEDIMRIEIDRRNSFWIDVLKAWAEFNYSEKECHNHIIWWNSLIRAKAAPLFFENAWRKGLLRVNQLYENGKAIPCQQLCEQYSLSMLQYNTIVTAIPPGIRRYVRNNYSMQQNEAEMRTVITLKKKPVPFIYKNLQKPDVTIAMKAQRWSADFEQDFLVEDLLVEFSNIYKISNVPKLRSFHFRFLHRAIVTNIQLQKWGIKPSNTCTLCNLSPETTYHLFFGCNEVKKLWDVVQDLCAQISPDAVINISYMSVCLNRIHDKANCIFNVFCLLTKHYIYKTRCAKKTD